MKREGITDNLLSVRVFSYMKLLNFVAVLWLSVFSAHAIRYSASSELAQAFLFRRGEIPLEWWRVGFLPLLMYMALLVLLRVEAQKPWEFLLRLGMEIVAALGICYLLQFSYSGIILLIIADILSHPMKWSTRLRLVILVVLIYLAVGSDIVANYLGTPDIATSLAYYRPDAHMILTTVISVLSLINVFVLVLFVVQITVRQVNENERVLQLNAELQEANHKLELFAEESALAAETRERNRIAREIHDTLGHTLTGLIAGLEACGTLIEISTDMTKVQLKKLEEVARSGITDVRQSVKQLRPDTLETKDLESAIQKMIDNMQSSTRVQINYDKQTEMKGFSKDEEDTIYRIFQESITNAIRHGNASVIDISVTREWDKLHIRIQDNGIGCKNIEDGFGLHHMKERLNLINGSLYCNGDDGFLIDAQIPIRMIGD